MGIKNRSQQDIADRMSVKDAIEEGSRPSQSIIDLLYTERQFFIGHPQYSGLPTHMWGTKALIDKVRTISPARFLPYNALQVTTVLFGHIKHFLPAISKELEAKLREVAPKPCLHSMHSFGLAPEA